MSADSVEVTEPFPMEVLDTVRAGDIEAFSMLLEVLTDEPQDPHQVHVQLQTAVDSATTETVVMREVENGAIAATATLNRVPVLTGNGSIMWIDDVVTDPAMQGKGLSKRIMDRLEVDASKDAREVLLTSQPDREAARRGYEKRGYVLYPASQLAVYRNSQISDANPDVDGAERMDDYTATDVETVAKLLKEYPSIIEANLHSALESDVTAIFAKRRAGAVSAIAVANLCPIPTGVKPWLNNINARTERDRYAVVAAAEQWLAERKASYVNVVAGPDHGLTENYKLRSTGLFIKPLIMVEAV